MTDSSPRLASALVLDDEDRGTHICLNPSSSDQEVCLHKPPLNNSELESVPRVQHRSSTSETIASEKED